MEKKEILALRLKDLGLEPERLRRISYRLNGRIPNDQLGLKQIGSMRISAYIERVNNWVGFQQWNGVAPTFQTMVSINNPWSHKWAMKKLMELGLTHLDWHLLPTSTIQPGMLEALSKKEILKLNAFALGTITKIAMAHVINKLGNSRGDERRRHLTVADLLNFKQDDSKDCVSLKKSFRETAKKLAALGFRYEDGPFMRYRSRRLYVETLVHEEGLTPKEAERFTQIADKRGYLCQFYS